LIFKTTYRPCKVSLLDFFPVNWEDGSMSLQFVLLATAPAKCTYEVRKNGL